jgi:hypothetical protein
MLALLAALFPLVAGSCSTTNDAIAAAAPAQATPAPAAFDHADFDALLKKHMTGDRVDYAALKAGRAPLDAYVDRVAKVAKDEFAKWPRDEQMAFWINAYNALTLRSIVDAYPINGSALSIHPRNSIRQIDDVWKKKHKVASQEVSLDDIENGILRKQWKDPRIHAAINCASKGCPALRDEAFTAAKLNDQLEDQMRKFVVDAARNTIDPKAKKVEVSSIFKWFGEDFGAKQDERAILGFLAKFGPSDWKPFLAAFDPDDVDFRDYDWSLNDVER